MKRVLILDHLGRKMVWDTSDKFLRNAAYVNLFRIFDQELNEFASNPDSAINAMIHMARAENPECCEAIMAYRRSSLPAYVEVDVTSPYGPLLFDRAAPPTRSVLLPEDVDLTEETN